VFVLRTSDGAITAFSRRAPKEGCLLVLASKVDVLPASGRVFFHDPCHGESFDRDGNHVGGPGLRGMYRYDVTVAADRILVDTSLARPGPFKQGLEGGDMSLDRLGVTTSTATRWRDALESAGAALQGEDKSGPFVWALGAFEDPGTGVITVDFTMDGIIGELQVGPPGALPDIDPTRPGARSFELAAGTLHVWNAGEAAPLSSAVTLADGQVLHLGVIPVTAPEVIEPSLDRLVTLIDQTVTAALD
jgi:hypothetical protein